MLRCAAVYARALCLAVACCVVSGNLPPPTPLLSEDMAALLPDIHQVVVSDDYVFLCGGAKVVMARVTGGGTLEVRGSHEVAGYDKLWVSVLRTDPEMLILYAWNETMKYASVEQHRAERNMTPTWWHNAGLAGSPVCLYHSATPCTGFVQGTQRPNSPGAGLVRNGTFAFTCCDGSVTSLTLGHQGFRCTTDPADLGGKLACRDLSFDAETSTLYASHDGGVTAYDYKTTTAFIQPDPTTALGTVPLPDGGFHSGQGSAVLTYDTAGAGHMLSTYEVATGQPIAQVQTSFAGHLTAFSSGGERYVALYDSGTGVVEAYSVAPGGGSLQRVAGVSAGNAWGTAVAGGGVLAVGEDLLAVVSGTTLSVLGVSPRTDVPDTAAPPTPEPTPAPGTGVPPTVPPTAVPATSAPTSGSTAVPAAAPALAPTPAPGSGAPTVATLATTGAPGTAQPEVQGTSAPRAGAGAPEASVSPPQPSMRPASLAPQGPATATPGQGAPEGRLDTTQQTHSPEAASMVESVAEVSAPLSAVSILTPGTSDATSAVSLVLVAELCHLNLPLGQKNFSRALHPTQWSLLGSHATGMVVGNTAVTLGFWAVMGGAVRLLVFAGILESTDPYGLCRFPSSPLFVLQFLLQGIGLGALALLFRGPSTTFPLGLVAAPLCLAVPIYVLRTVLRSVPNKAYLRADSSVKSRAAIFFTGEGAWVSRSPAHHWVYRYSSVVRGYRESRAYYSVVEVLANLLLAATQAGGTSDYSACGHQKLFAGVVFLALLCAEAGTRPRERAVDNWLLCLFYALQAAAMGLMASAYYASDPNHWCLRAAAVCLACAVGVLVLKVAVCLAAEVYLLVDGRQARLQGEAFGEAPPPGDDTAEDVELSFLTCSCHSPSCSCPSPLAACRRTGLVCTPPGTMPLLCPEGRPRFRMSRPTFVSLSSSSAGQCETALLSFGALQACAASASSTGFPPNQATRGGAARAITLPSGGSPGAVLLDSEDGTELTHTSSEGYDRETDSGTSGTDTPESGCIVIKSVVL